MAATSPYLSTDLNVTFSEKLPQTNMAREEPLETPLTPNHVLSFYHVVRFVNISFYFIFPLPTSSCMNTNFLEAETLLCFLRFELVPNIQYVLNDYLAVDIDSFNCSH